MTLLTLIFGLVWLAVLVRAILRPHRQPASRVAWVLVIMLLPVLGILIYILLGETNIGRRRVARSRQVLAELPPAIPMTSENDPRFNPSFPNRTAQMFRVGKSVNGFLPVGGNSARKTRNSTPAIS